MKRIIFTLLYDNGHFMLSRNFRLQKVGNIDWLFNNYDLPKVSHGLDELMIIDVSRGNRNIEKFCDTLKKISRKCFIPLTAGGGISDFSVANQYLRSGADKLLLSTAFFKNPELCTVIADHYGKQCVVGVADYEIQSDGNRKVKLQHGQLVIEQNLEDWAFYMEKIGAGEILFQSIDRDGTGTGLDLELANQFPLRQDLPYILMGGIGKAEHIIDGLSSSFVDAVATANLFNFIGSTFLEIRENMSNTSITMATWKEKDYDDYHNIFKR